jgi:hypothetical protein
MLVEGRSRCPSVLQMPMRCDQQFERGRGCQDPVCLMSQVRKGRKTRSRRGGQRSMCHDLGRTARNGSRRCQKRKPKPSRVQVRAYFIADDRSLIFSVLVAQKVAQALRLWSSGQMSTFCSSRTSGSSENIWDAVQFDVSTLQIRTRDDLLLPTYKDLASTVASMASNYDGE